MPQVPDFTDPRYLNEVGWFLYRDKYGSNYFGSSYAEERLAYSKMVLDEVLSYCDQDQEWLLDKTVVSIGCGCTGDLAVWPAAVKIAVDPLLYVYQKLGMLVEDTAGKPRTVYLSVAVEDLPLLDDCADLVLCRNALDHMPDPKDGLTQIWRILKSDGALFLSVDIGGQPTPDEPSPLSTESLSALLQDRFEVLAQTDNHRPHNKGRGCSVRILARKKHRPTVTLDKKGILRAYEASITQDQSKGLEPARASIDP